ncbi:MAG TPA: histidinol dehydrogenase [Microbacterium sp.]|jgi:histidinol dehydrogenase|nr:histidinol dehydrogenase [Microbacterium sp.]|tara:strand:+ start:7631 stop:8953 length:1323 start_codon:yes stop_codon:yes gene_type:complete
MLIRDARGGHSAALPVGRAGALDESILEPVAAIIAEVRRRGRDAVLDYTERFDGIRPARLRAPAAALELAWAEQPSAVRVAMDEAIRRVEQGHRAQLPAPRVTEFGPGSTVRQEYRPVARAGLYVPGGKAAYASSVIMNAVPAQVAGVNSIVVACPPARATGLPPAPVLAACHRLGIDEVFAMGGAQAIAALAYGMAVADDDALRPVDMVTGPGNAYVAAAKSLLQQVVGIDSVAGPTEVLVLADETADPVFVAADLISQAEHSEDAASVLVTPDSDLAAAVSREVDAQLQRTRNRDRAKAALTSSQSFIALVDDLDDACAFASRYGPEHLEVMTRNPEAVAARVQNAGAIFLGAWSPVSLGDYAAGSNHVLPTGGSSRHSAALSVMTFLRPTQVVNYDLVGLRAAAPTVLALAAAEGLWAHGDAVSVRTDTERPRTSQP